MKETEKDEDFLGFALGTRIFGGSQLKVEARIQADSVHPSTITPMYIREGKTRVPTRL